MLCLKRSNSKGAVLLEVLLAVAILAAGLTVLIQSMSTHMRAIVLADQYARAALALDGFMGQIVMDNIPKTLPPDESPCPQINEPYQCSIALRETILPSPHPQVFFRIIDGNVHWRTGKNTRNLGIVFYSPFNQYL